VSDLAAFDIVRLLAPNPGPLTLSGTNTWIVGRDPAYVIDPGPLLEEHLDAIVAETDRRGGIGGIALTHGHADHSEATMALRDRTPHRAAVAAAQAPGADVVLADGDLFGPLRAFATPGHATDHLAFVAGAACFTGDAVLGEGSVFVEGAPGALAGYLAALRRLRELELAVLCPGHGPPIWDPAGKLDAYLTHRAEREERLLDALDRGLRDRGELLDDVWADAPAVVRPIAALTLEAHLHKLGEEGRLPEGVSPRAARAPDAWPPPAE
jgi:glyoxylase-like metal-dependent hydrolase (beta-lactamase superfamily II)